MPAEWNFADVWETVANTVPDAIAQVHGDRRVDWRTYLPKDIVDKLSAAMQNILARPDVRERMLANCIEPTPSDPAAFKAMVRKQLDVWGGKVKDAGLQPE